MKKSLTVAVALVFVFSITTCEGLRESTPQISVAEVLKNPVSYLGKTAIFRDGTVVFKKQKERTSVVVVVSHPSPKIKSVDDLHESEVLPIKVAAADYKNVNIGSVIAVEGRIERAKKKGKVIYYIGAKNVTITGHEDINDPDFEKLVEVINQKAKDDAFELYMYFLIFALSTSL